MHVLGALPCPKKRAALLTVADSGAAIHNVQDRRIRAVFTLIQSRQQIRLDGCYIVL
jgi:hypothetical protein